MKEFWKKIIIPTIIMIWATTYYAEVSSLPARNGLLIKPVYWALLVVYIINIVADYIECRQKTRASGAAGNVARVTWKRPDLKEIGPVLKRIYDSTGGRVALAFAAMIVYVAVIKKVGFCISTFVLLAALLFLMDLRGWKSLLLFPLIAVVILYVVFKIFLRIYLPAGFFM